MLVTSSQYFFMCTSVCVFVCACLACVHASFVCKCVKILTVRYDCHISQKKENKPELICVVLFTHISICYWITTEEKFGLRDAKARKTVFFKKSSMYLTKVLLGLWGIWKKYYCYLNNHMKVFIFSILLLHCFGGQVDKMMHSSLSVAAPSQHWQIVALKCKPLKK